MRIRNSYVNLLVCGICILIFTEDVIGFDKNGSPTIDDIEHLKKIARPPEFTPFIYKNKHGWGHQGVTTNGKQWFVMDTDKIFRYESDDFSKDQSTLIRNMNPLSVTKAKGIRGDHLGAPCCWKGKIYTFLKTYKAYKKGKCDFGIWLIWYSQKDLKYMGHLKLKLPQGDTPLRLTEKGKPVQGTKYVMNLAGGPAILNDNEFYACITQKKQWWNKKIAVFNLKTGNFIRYLNLKGKGVGVGYSRPQGIYRDKYGDIYVVQTCYGIKKWNAEGVYQQNLFRNGKWCIMEGFVYDPDSGKLVISITRYRKDLYKKGEGHLQGIVKVNLKKDILRYVDGKNGSEKNDGYTLKTAKKYIIRRNFRYPGSLKPIVNTPAMAVIFPGMTLLVSNYGIKNPLRETIVSQGRNTGLRGKPVTIMGYPEVLCITGTDDFSQDAVFLGNGKNLPKKCIWRKSRTKGEYYLTDIKGQPVTDIKVKVLASCSKGIWKEKGLKGVIKRKKGIVGKLKSNEWAWGNNDGLRFSTLYYRPEENTAIKDIHIEAGQRKNLIILNRKYVICKNVKIFFPNRLSGNGVIVSKNRGCLVKFAK